MHYFVCKSLFDSVIMSDILNLKIIYLQHDDNRK